MKLTSVLAAKATWLFEINRLNPKGLALKPLLDGVTERYKFAKAPANMLDLDEKKGLSFQQGEFSTADGRDIFIALSIYNDGFVVTTSSSTADATEFLEDLGLFVQSSGFSFPASDHVRKGFSSVLQVEYDTPLLAINPQLERIIQFIESRLVSMDGKPRHFQMAALGFWSEDLTKSFAPVAFKFERKIGLPFEAHQFYSEAPLQTHEHLELLEELETILAI